MGVKCCHCLKDKKDDKTKPAAPVEIKEKAPILNLEEINPSEKPEFNPQSSIQTEQFRASFLKAIEAEDLEEVKGILAKGFPITDPISHDKFTALQISCKLGKQMIVEYLIEKVPGVVIDQTDETEKWTGLMLASMNGHVGIVKYLLEKGAKPELLSADNKSALDYAESEEIRAILSDITKKTA